MKKLLLAAAVALGFAFTAVPDSQAGRIYVGIGLPIVPYPYYPPVYYSAYYGYPGYYPYGYPAYYRGGYYRAGYRPYYHRHGHRVYRGR